jgi:CRP-like cAMP-binding protein
MFDNLINALQRLITLDDNEKDIIRSLFKEKTYEKGDFFLKEGQICQHTGFIQKGLVRYFINKDGEELIYGFGKEGNFACSYESFLDHSASTKNIQTIENTTMLTISYNDLQTFYAEIKGGERFGRQMAEYIFVESVKQLTSMYTDPPEQRYRNFLQAYPDLQQRIPQYYISSFVGVKPQSLSRIRKRLAGSW